MSVLELKDIAQFDEITKESEWTLIDFWAPWCAPCQIMLPVFCKVADDFKSTVTATTIDVDEHTDIAKNFGIRGIPALVLLHKGEVAAQLTGAQPKETLTNWLRQHIKKANNKS